MSDQRPSYEGSVADKIGKAMRGSFNRGLTAGFVAGCLVGAVLTVWLMRVFAH